MCRPMYHNVFQRYRRFSKSAAHDSSLSLRTDSSREGPFCNAPFEEGMAI